MSKHAIKLPKDAPQELLDAVEENDIEVDDGEEGEGLTNEQFATIVAAAARDAVNYIDEDIAPDRERAMQYYRGDLFGNEEEGLSQVVMTEVRDTVQAVLPSLLRVFVSGENAVEFAPRTEAKVAEAEQATDYVSYVFMNDNPGFQLLWNGFKDALVSKTGVYKWWTKTSTKVYEESYTGLEEGVVNVLAAVPGVELLGSSPEPTGGIDQETGAPIPPTFSVKIRRKVEERRQVVECIPPEELIIARNARDLDSADFVAHRCLKTMSELVEMGFDEEEIEEHGSTTSNLEFNEAALVRNPALTILAGQAADTIDESMNRYLFIESYIRADRDGDGVAELRRVCSINDNCYILFDEVVDEVKFAVLCPDPEPHLAIGSSLADQVMDLQLIKSNVVRKTLDSLAQSIHPRTGYVEGQVNVDDLMNPETGGLIRMTQPGMIQDLSQPFVGQQAMPIIAWLDDVRAARTGVSKASQGLDPDVLQSTTKAAVTATVAAAEQRLEMIARIFAETGIKRLFKGLLREIVRNQDKARMVRLRGEWVNIDPRDWDAEMDVIVNVGLGNGGIAAQTQMLMQIIGKQEQILQQYGPSNPLVDVRMYRNAMVKLISINGFKDANSYFKPVTDEVLAQLAQPPQQPQQPDPAAILAQAQAAKLQNDVEIANKQFQLDAEKAAREDDLKRDQLDADIMLRAWEIQAKNGTQLQVENIYALIQRDRDARKAEVEQAKVALNGQHQAEQRQQAADLARQRVMQMQQQQPPGVQ
jgi:hypothetical protein